MAGVLDFSQIQFQLRRTNFEDLANRRERLMAYRWNPPSSTETKHDR